MVTTEFKQRSSDTLSRDATNEDDVCMPSQKDRKMLAEIRCGAPSSSLDELNISLVALYHAFLGQLLGFVMPSTEVTIVFGLLFAALFFLFMDSSPPASAIPSEHKWLYQVTPHRYAISSLIALVFGDCPSNATFDSTLGQFVNVGSEIGCQPLTNASIALGNITVKQFIEYDDIGRNFVALIGICVLFHVLALLCFRFASYKKN